MVSTYLMKNPLSFTRYICTGMIYAYACRIHLIMIERHTIESLLARTFYVYSCKTPAYYFSDGYSRPSGILHHVEKVVDILEGDEDIPPPSDDLMHADPDASSSRSA